MAETPLGKLVVELGLDSIQFDKGIDNVKNSLKVLANYTKASKSEMNLLSGGMGSTANAMQALKREYDATGVIVGKYTDIVKKSKQGIDEITTAYQNGAVTQEHYEREMKKLEKQMTTNQSNALKYQASMNDIALAYKNLAIENYKANNVFFKMGGALETAGGKMTTFGRNLGNVGREWTRVGGLIGVGAGLIMKSAIDYEQALAGVKKTTDANVTQMGQLSQGFLDLSKNIPVSAKELANIGQTAGQLGIHIPNILSFTDTIAKLGTATNIVGEEGASQLARFANIMGMSQDKFSNFGSTLVALGKFIAHLLRNQ